MKLRVVLCLATLSLFIGCSESPEDIAEAFSMELRKGKLSEAKKYATEPSARLLEVSGSLGASPEIDPAFEFEMTDKIRDGNRAIVRYKDGDDVASLSLVRIDGEWKVDLDATRRAEEEEREKAALARMQEEMARSEEEHSRFMMRQRAEEEARKEKEAAEAERKAREAEAERKRVAEEAEAKRRRLEEEADRERQRRFAPDGIVFNIEAISVVHDNGIASIPPGSELQVTSKNSDGKISVTNGELAATVSPESVTNDRDLAAQQQNAYESQQAAIKRRLAQQAAEIASQKEWEASQPTPTPPPRREQRWGTALDRPAYR